MTVPITGNLTETQRFPAPLSGWGRMAGGPGRQTAPDIRQSKAAGAGYAEEETCPPKGAALPGCLRTSTSLTRTTGRPKKKCIEYSPHMEQQHGLLVVDKPRGLSSAQCTNRFKRLGQKKIGHAGHPGPDGSGRSVGASRARDQNLRISHGGRRQSLSGHCPARADH